MIVSFLNNWLFVLACCVGFGVAGWPVAALFRSQMNWAPLVAPLAGILILPLSTLALYTIANVTFSRAAVVSLSALALAAAVMLAIERPQIRPAKLPFVVLVVLAITSVVTWIVLRLSIEAGEPALQYFIGSDHLGYAIVGDWLVDHPAAMRPRSDPQFPYESFPQIMFTYEPRFGHFAYLGLISLVTGERGTLSYDRACAVLLAAGVLGVSAGFARTRVGLVILAAGLMTSHWYDYARIGFFGKALAYPGMMLVVALALAMMRGPGVIRVPFLMLATAGAAIDLNGAVCAFLLLLIGVPFLLTRFAIGVPTDRGGAVQQLVEGGVWLAVTVITAVLAMGTLARPLGFGYPDFKVGWDYVAPRALEIQHQGPALVTFSADTIAALNGLSILLTLFVAVLAWRRRAAEAFALAAPPVALVMALRLANAPAIVMQLMGLIYPFSLCAIVALAETPATLANNRPITTLRRHALSLGAMLVALVMLGMRVPRLLAAISYYAGAQTPAVYIYKRSDIERIANAIGTNTARIDIGYVQAAFLLLVELAPRGIDLQWTPRGWKAILGYRVWDPPTYTKNAQIRIVSLVEDPVPQGEIILQTNQYILIREPQSP